MYQSEIKSIAHTYQINIKNQIEVNTGLSNVLYLIDRRFQSILKLSENVIYIDALESKKNLITCEAVLRTMVEMRMNRSSELIVIGGGLVQDIGTLVASVYMRGIKWTYIPTTLMSMVDSCIGGKSSLNVMSYKNIVGNIYPPQRIQICTDFTKTLMPIDFASGELEAMKICYTKGMDDFDKFLDLLNTSRTNTSDLPTLVHHVISCKKYFVEEDEFDTGIRQLLNFGHTFGHALETSSDYKIPHGVAIGIGMLAALNFVENDSNRNQLRLKESILAIFSRIHDCIPGLISSVDFLAFELAFQADKKHKNEFFYLVLPTSDELKIVSIPRNNESIERIVNSLKESLKLLGDINVNY